MAIDASRPSSRSTWLVDAVEGALGRRERPDQVLPRSGGPAGNARLTAWLGLVLLVLFAAEGVTVLGVHQLLGWHIVVGAIAIGPVALKLASTGWRMVAYYARVQRYRVAGPPPLVYRVVGPLVVLTSVAVLLTGVLLLLLGEERSRQAILDFGGLRVDWLFLHQASFFAWFGVMTIHVLGRTIPALRAAQRSLQAPRAVEGVTLRLVSVVLALAVGVVLALWLVGREGGWARNQDRVPPLHSLGPSAKNGVSTLRLRVINPDIHTA